MGFDISYKDRRKYNSLIKSIFDNEILDDVNTADFMGTFDPYEIFSNNLILAPKVPRYAYSILLDHSPPEKSLNFWNDLFNFDVEEQDWEWEDIHMCNFKCTIETKLRSFYFKLFHRAIALNVFI